MASTIFTWWFRQPLILFSSDPDRIRLWHGVDFSKHDIIFAFEDFCGTVFEFRCPAEPFLTSPWPGVIDGTWLSQIECPQGDGTDRPCSEWLLGMVSAAGTCIAVSTNLPMQPTELLLDVLHEDECDAYRIASEDRQGASIHTARASAHCARWPLCCKCMGYRTAQIPIP